MDNGDHESLLVPFWILPFGAYTNKLIYKNGLILKYIVQLVIFHIVIHRGASLCQVAADCSIAWIYCILFEQSLTDKHLSHF